MDDESPATGVSDIGEMRRVLIWKETAWRWEDGLETVTLHDRDSPQSLPGVVWKNYFGSPRRPTDESAVAKRRYSISLANERESIIDSSMQTSGFGVPVFIRADHTGEAELLTPVTLSKSGGYDEGWLQRLLFSHPATLPIKEIDASFFPLLPLCMEMDTPAGPVDVVYVTPTGRLALLEAKLWRNPEARRKVIAQILDYAKELPSWDYSRLEAAVRQARKNDAMTKGENFQGIAEFVAKTNPDLVLHQFQDAVTKSLAKGDYLLLIAGDGIREGVGAIAQYLDRNGSLHFTFGLVECAIYDTPNGGRFVQPRVLAKTTNILRTVYISGTNQVAVEDAEDEEYGDDESQAAPNGNRSPQETSNERERKAFWVEFLERTKGRVEEAQIPPKPSNQGFLKFHMPKGADAWITVYLERYEDKSQAGVMLRLKRTEAADGIFMDLGKAKEEINKALGVDAEWYSADDFSTVRLEKDFPGQRLIESREDVLKWLADQTERFISVFRPRIDQILRDQGE